MTLTTCLFYLDCFADVDLSIIVKVLPGIIYIPKISQRAEAGCKYVTEEYKDDGKIFRKRK